MSGSRAAASAEEASAPIPAASRQSSFYYSFLLLPPERRRAIFEVYAFMRAVDDAVDEVGALPLEFWSAELERVYGAGEPTHPIAQALQHAVRAYAIPRSHFEALIRGCRMDLEDRRYETIADLEDYSWHVAGVVGRACLSIFGVSEDDAGVYADRLGIALQLVNIVRDVGEDARRDRIYLPREDLVRFGVSDEELGREVASPGVRALLQFEGERAAAALRFAREALPRSRKQRKRLLAAQVMGAVYTRLLKQMQREGYPSLERRVRLGRGTKAWVAARTWFRVSCGF